MLRLLALLLPALLPSWAFFRTVEASPRVEWRLLSGPDMSPGAWQRFRPRPHHVTPAQMLVRLFWNPSWNEKLYLVSLAERLMLEPTDHSVQEIHDTIARAVSPSETASSTALQFRLVFVSGRGPEAEETVTFVAEPAKLGPSV